MKPGTQALQHKQPPMPGYKKPLITWQDGDGLAGVNDSAASQGEH